MSIISPQIPPHNVRFLELESIASSIGSALHGLYIGAAILSLYLLSSQGKGFSGGKLGLSIMISIMLFLDMISTASSTYFVARDIRMFAETTHRDRERFIPRSTAVITIIDIVVLKANYFLSDLVIVWRAWFLYGKKPLLIQLSLSFCVVVTLGATFAHIVMSIEQTLNHDSRRMHLEYTYTVVRLFLPVSLWLTNVIATSVIAFKTWMLYRAFKAYEFQNSTRVKFVMNILLLMVETAFLHSILWMIIIVDNTGKLSLEARYLLTSIIPHVTGIYPCLMVILIIQKQRKYESMTSTVSSTGFSLSTSARNE